MRLDLYKRAVDTVRERSLNTNLKSKNRHNNKPQKMCLPQPGTAAYERRCLLLQLSDSLSEEDCKKIVYLEDLPKMLTDKQPLEVLVHLEMCGRTSTENLVRILQAINRHDAAKKMKEFAAKNRKRPSKKDSGIAVLKLEESLSLAIKNCDVLMEQLEYLKLAACKGGKKRIEEVIAEAKAALKDGVHRKLRYASCLVSQSQVYESNSPPSSPECLTRSSSDSESASATTQPLAFVSRDELKKAAEKLKSSTPPSGKV